MITEESFLDFKCPYCGDAASFPQENAGSVQSCPSCSESLVVPEDGSEVGKAIPLPIKTQRLIIRRFGPGDWKDLMELTSDEELFRHIEGRPLEEDEVLHWLESDSHARLTTPNQRFCLGMETKEGSKLIGYLGLALDDPQRLQAVISIYLNRQFQRQGYALEAVRAVLDFCLKGIKLHRVSAACDSRDAAACRLFEKAGLRREGEFLKDHFLHGEWANTTWFGLLSEERGERDVKAVED
jgi:aminoglycoside 6'-N-acetyltransferase